MLFTKILPIMTARKTKSNSADQRHTLNGAGGGEHRIAAHLVEENIQLLGGRERAEEGLALTVVCKPAWAEMGKL
jgi:hypothetical protein